MHKRFFEKCIKKLLKLFNIELFDKNKYEFFS